MSRKPKVITDYDYLYDRDGRFTVRVQIPPDVKAAIGQGEFKKSLGGDLPSAKKQYYGVVTEFLANIEAARSLAVQPGAPDAVTGKQPSPEEVDAACYDHFQRMAARMRGKVAIPIGDAPSELRNRAEGYRAMINNHVLVYADDHWNSMSANADWLCQENGWIIAPDSPQYERLCQTMLRARLQCYRDELRRIEGKMGPDPDCDPMFNREPPKRSPPTADLGNLIARFTASRSDKWSESTRRNYIIINRVIEEVCGRDLSLDEINEEFCNDVRSVLCKLPANYQKNPATKGRPIPEVVKIAAARSLPLISPATINGHLTKLAAIIRFGRDRGVDHRQPNGGDRCG